ncbi:hypothetical protein [Kaistia sp. 32K]|uniref:hypothetical protein n=1 Tax=Kaistia sp. 32K TaxID=2795690 RepID=UPI001AEE1D81|nr:hypothetical protein [Kaistia sp. 32K]
MARKLTQWADTTVCYVQDSDCHCWPLLGEGVRYCEDEWDVTDSDGISLMDLSFDAGTVRPGYLAEDHATAIVTRSQWQAERERLGLAAGKSFVEAERDTWERRACDEATRVVELTAQRDELLAALELLWKVALPVSNVAHNLGQHDEQWSDSIYPGIQALDNARNQAAEAIARAKGGAA